MKIVTVLGTRPEIIRLSLIIEKLDRVCEHVLVHTEQNFEPTLSEVFFDELGVRQPDVFLGVRADTVAGQIGQILCGCETVFERESPDRLLILGDTNSALCAIIAKRMGIPVFHMEAGNRCYDDRVPEEINRRLIDHSSDLLMPYTERSRANLLREGMSSERIIVTGNPIFEIITHHEDHIAQSSVLGRLGLTERNYVLVTLHRAENVDVPDRLQAFTRALAELDQRLDIPVIVSTHPRTRERLLTHGIDNNSRVSFFEPFGFFDFIALERNARIVLSDSGTVQEECAIFGVPNVTLRDVTERPETIECGSNVLSGADPEAVRRSIDLVLSRLPAWSAPREYLVPNVSDTVLGILCGYIRPTA